MIRIETTRRIDFKQPKGRNPSGSTSTFNEHTEADAIKAIRISRDASEAMAPGYCPLIEVRLYDFDTFMEWVRDGDLGTPPVAFRILSAAEIAAL